MGQFRDLLESSSVLKTKGLSKIKFYQETQYLDVPYRNIAGSGNHRYYKVKVEWESKSGDFTSFDGVYFWLKDSFILKDEVIHLGANDEKTTIKIKDLPSKIAKAIEKFTKGK